MLENDRAPGRSPPSSVATESRQLGEVRYESEDATHTTDFLWRSLTLIKWYDSRKGSDAQASYNSPDHELAGAVRPTFFAVFFQE